MSKGFSPSEFSLSTIDLIEPEMDQDDQQWQEYCRTASTLNRRYLLDAVLSELDADDSPLLALIDEALTQPYEPGSQRVNLSEAQRIGKALIRLVNQCVDSAVTLNQMGEGY